MLHRRIGLGMAIAFALMKLFIPSIVGAQDTAAIASHALFLHSEQDPGLAQAEGTILQTAASGEVLVSLGASDGVQVRDLLQVTRAEQDVGWLEVLEVTEQQCTCLSKESLAKRDQVRLVHAVDVSGVCKDESGAPLENVLVTLFRRSGNYTDAPKLITQQSSGEGGEFSFVAIDTKRTAQQETDLLLAITKPGYVSLTTYVPLEAENQQLVLRNETGMLVGIIHDANGKPLAGATVHTQSRSRHIHGIHSAITDSDGKFRILDLAKWSPEPDSDARRYLNISHPEYAHTRAHYSSIPDVVNVKLPPPAVIKGRVMDAVEDIPAAGILISAQGCGESGWYQTRSDSDGNYVLRVSADKYNIWAEMPDRIAVAIESIEAIPGKTLVDVNIPMVQGGIVHGKCIDAEGKTIKPTGRMYVAHYGPARPRSGAAVTSTLVRPDGSFRLRVAPGANYVYLMSGGSSANFSIEDRQDIEINLVGGKQAAVPMRAMRLRPARRIGEPEVKPAPRDNTPVGQLLDKLERQNQDGTRFSDAWLLTMKQVVDLGEAAVPELCKELDVTNDDMMLRCLGFMLRAIDSPQAVPSLIRSIPKTLRPPGSDMGLRVTDEALEVFAHRHDLDEVDRDGRYGFGRPVREILGALQSITNEQLQDDELYHSFLVGNDFQKALKTKMFVRHAVRWQTWWEANAQAFDVPKQFQLVNLPPFNVAMPMAKLPPDARYSLGQMHSNWVLESFIDPEAQIVFFDIDTGRVAALPDQWRKQVKNSVPLDEIEDWAHQEGFDLMGAQVTMRNNQGTCYALRSLGMRAWEVEDERWKQRPQHIQLEELLQEGRESSEFLLASSPSGVDYLGTATFFVLTREGTPAMLFVGVSVMKDDLQPGGLTSGKDNELRESAFRKGRRFAYGLFELDEDN